MTDQTCQLHYLLFSAKLRVSIRLALLGVYGMLVIYMIHRRGEVSPVVGEELK